MAAGTAGYVQYYPVYKARHGESPLCLTWLSWTPKLIVMRLKEQWSGPSWPAPPVQILLLLCSCSSNDVHDSTAAAGAEFDSAGLQCEQGVVSATANACTGVEVGASLADDGLG